MNGPSFTTALSTLGLDNHQAAAWLGVSVRAVQRYRVSGAPGPVERAIERGLKCLEYEEDNRKANAMIDEVIRRLS